MSPKTKKMLAIKEEVLNLPSSELVDFRKENNSFPVIGEGSHDAQIMFIGEAPGRNEAKTGKPFCGAAGKILDELLDSISLKRDKVYITNIVKDRPPENRDPSPDEIETYVPFLDKQIEIIKPKVIATLGRFSMVYIINRYGDEDFNKTISEAHGTKIEVGGYTILPLYHPAAAIYNRALRDTLLKDFKILATKF